MFHRPDTLCFSPPYRQSFHDLFQVALEFLPDGAPLRVDFTDGRRLGGKRAGRAGQASIGQASSGAVRAGKRRKLQSATVEVRVCLLHAGRKRAATRWLGLFFKAFFRPPNDFLLPVSISQKPSKPERHQPTRPGMDPRRARAISPSKRRIRPSPTLVYPFNNPSTSVCRGIAQIRS